MMEKSNTKEENINLPLFNKLQSAYFIFTVLGLIAAIELTHIHIETHTNEAFNSICAISKGINCETVAKSPYAVFLGVPVAIWGLIVYLLMALFQGILFLKKYKRPFFTGLYFSASLLSVAAAGILAYISHVIIGSLCIFCASLYVVNTILLILSIMLLYTSKESFVQAIIKDFHHLIQIKTVTFIIAGLAALLIAGSMLFIPPYWHHLSWNDLPSMRSGIDKNGHRYKGAENPVLTIEEFSDYQCSHCRFAHKQVRMIIGPYKNKVRLVHRNMPMDSHCNPNIKIIYHQRSCEFAYAAECAGLQNKFWQMNDAIFAIQNSMAADRINIEEIAKKLKLDTNKLFDCIKNNKEIKNKIVADIKRGTNLQIPGTPIYYLGGVRKPGGFTKADLIKRLNQLENKNHQQ